MKTLREKVLEMYDKSIFLCKENEYYLSLERLESSRMQFENNEINIIVSGEVKVGKSTIINNLLQDNLCTVDAGVCTNTVSIIRWGEVEKITVHFLDDPDSIEVRTPKVITKAEVSEYVSEQHNQDNCKNVSVIEIETPNPLLKNGVVLYDTPGLGSLNPQHAATTFGIAANADGLILVSDTVRELSSEEIEYAKKLIKTVELEAFIQVVTKADTADPDIIIENNRRHLAEIEGWSEEQIAICGVSNTIYGDYLKNKDEDDFKESGYSDFLAYFNAILSKSEDIIARKHAAIIISIIADEYNRLILLKDSIENKSDLENEIVMENLNAKIGRLNELIDNQQEWHVYLDSILSATKNAIFSRLEKDKEDVKKALVLFVNNDDYLKNINLISSNISSDIASRIGGYPVFFKTQLTDAYMQLIKKTNLLLICQYSDIVPTKTDDNFDNRISVGGVFNHMLRTGMIGMGIGATIGAVVGGVTALLVPGGVAFIAAFVSTFASIGAAIGKVFGAIRGWFIGKEQIRAEKISKILSEFNPKIGEVFSKLGNNINIALADANCKFRLEFIKAVKDEKQRISKDVDTLKENAKSNKEQKCEKIVKLTKIVTLFQSIATGCKSVMTR